MNDLTTTTLRAHSFASEVTKATVQSTSYPLGIQLKVSFANGLGASIIRNDFTYGGWEVLPMDANHTDFSGYSARHGSIQSVLSHLEDIASV